MTLEYVGKSMCKCKEERYLNGEDVCNLPKVTNQNSDFGVINEKNHFFLCGSGDVREGEDG